MTQNNDNFGIKEHLLNRDLLDSSQKLIANSNQIITRLQAQIQHCKLLIESLAITK